jgi:hypothetical protein
MESHDLLTRGDPFDQGGSVVGPAGGTGSREIFAIHHDATRTAPAVGRRHMLPTGPDETVILGIAGISSTTVSPLGGEASEPIARRAIRRAIRRLDDVGEFLTTGALRSTGRALSVKGKKCTEDIFVRANLGQSEHDVHLRGARSLQGNVGNYNEVSIHSGICLFSDMAAQFRDEHGRTPSLLKHLAGGPTSPLVEITADPGLSFYEFLTLRHLPRLIADVADSLPEGIPLSITVDVPQAQYYGYLLEALRSGLASSELAVHWFDLVDERNRHLRGLFKRRLQVELSRIGCHGCLVDVLPAPSMEILGDFIRDEVQRGRVPSAEDLVAVVLRTGDPIWELIAAHAHPETIVQLNDACNIAEILRGTGIVEEGSHRLAIVVDNYQEFPRREHVQRLLDSVGSPGRLAALGIYAAERIMNVDQDGYVTTPYLLDPGRHIRDDSGRTVDLFRYADALYANWYEQSEEIEKI